MVHVRSIVEDLFGSLRAFSLYMFSARECQLDAKELDCNSSELDTHWHRSILKHQTVFNGTYNENFQRTNTT